MIFFLVFLARHSDRTFRSRNVTWPNTWCTRRRLCSTHKP